MPLHRCRRGKNALKDITVAWLVASAGLPLRLLHDLASDSEAMYKPTRRQPKKGGGTRLIDPVRREYRSVLRRLGKALAKMLGVHPAWHGGARGRSTFTSARLHLGAKFIVTRDVKNCFPEINRKKMRNALRGLGARPELADFLSCIMTVRDRLPQGGPLSNLALNLFFLRQDEHLMKFAQAKGGEYGRLVDDFVMSAPSWKAGVQFGRMLDTAIESRGLTVNGKKRKARGLLRGDQLKEIHSLIVNSRRGVRPKKEHKRRAIELAELYARRCKCATPRDVPDIASLRQHVTGWMYYLGQCDRSPAQHISHMISAGDAIIRGMLKRSGRNPSRGKWWLATEAYTRGHRPKRRSRVAKVA